LTRAGWGRFRRAMIIDLRYTVGYKDALRHVIQWFDSHDEYLRFNKLRTHKGYKLIMIRRCHNTESDCYERYGGRGITVCREWIDSFEQFYKWAMENGYADDLTIDRINNDGNYEPSNCRWVTIKRQLNNKRDNRYIIAFGKKQTIAEWRDETGINHATLTRRFNSGWPPEMALTVPVSRSNTHKKKLWK